MTLNDETLRLLRIFLNRIANKEPNHPDRIEASMLYDLLAPPPPPLLTLKSSHI